MSEGIKTGTMCVDMDDIMKRIESERKAAQARSVSLKDQIIKELKKIGAATATIRYEGCGDSGSVEDIEVRDKDGKEIPLSRKTKEHFTYLADPVEEPVRTPKATGLWERLKALLSGKKPAPKKRKNTAPKKPPQQAPLEGSEGKLEGPTVTVLRRSSTFKDGKWINEEHEREVSLYEGLEELAYDALEGHHPGWEINDGAYGKLEIFVEEETAILAHNTRITDVEYWENEL